MVVHQALERLRREYRREGALRVLARHAGEGGNVRHHVMGDGAAAVVGGCVISRNQQLVDGLVGRVFGQVGEMG